MGTCKGAGRDGGRALPAALRPRTVHSTCVAGGRAASTAFRTHSRIRRPPPSHAPCAPPPSKSATARTRAATSGLKLLTLPGGGMATGPMRVTRKVSSQSVNERPKSSRGGSHASSMLVCEREREQREAWKRGVRREKRGGRGLERRAAAKEPVSRWSDHIPLTRPLYAGGAVQRAVPLACGLRWSGSTSSSSCLRPARPAPRASPPPPAPAPRTRHRHRSAARGLCCFTSRSESVLRCLHGGLALDPGPGGEVP